MRFVVLLVGFLLAYVISPENYATWMETREDAWAWVVGGALFMDIIDFIRGRD